MKSKSTKLFVVAVGLLGFVACHPAGCYGPKAFDYNTGGVTASNLAGVYRLDDLSRDALRKGGFNELSGHVELKSDMTFHFVNVPCAWNFPKAEGYASAKGRWRLVKSGAIWEVEIYDYPFEEMCGYVALKFPVLRESPPHGLQLHIDHDSGYWVRVEHDRK